MKRLTLLALCAAIGAGLACSGAASKKTTNDGQYPSGDDSLDPGLPPPRDPDIVNDDAGAFGPGTRGRDGGASDAGSRSPPDAAAPDASQEPDASDNPDASSLPDASAPDASAPDSGTVTPDSGVVVPGDACGGTGVLGAGDLAVVEIMIASQSGSGDRGEWLEVQSTRNCSLNLKGLHFESPRGTQKDTGDVTVDTWLPANGIFVIADSSDPVLNHNLPTPIYTWDHQPADVLVNSGDTVTLTAGSVTVETFTYPTFSVLHPGVSISFPADCAWSDRSSWARWSFSVHAWSGNFLGTPNADNTDVTCY